MNKVLKFLNLLDRANNLSVTSVALYIVLVKIAVSPFDWIGAAALVPVLVNYMHKRYESSKAQTKTDVSTLTDFNEIKQQLKTLEDQQEKVSKTFEEAKKLLSMNNLSTGFKAPIRNTKI